MKILHKVQTQKGNLEKESDKEDFENLREMQQKADRDVPEVLTLMKA